MIQRCRAALKFDVKSENLILPVNAKLNGPLTQEISSFQLHDHTGGFAHFRSLNVNYIKNSLKYYLSFSKSSISA